MVQKQLDPKTKLLEAISKIKELADVEELISSKLVSEAKLLQEIPTYLLNLGGKRIRPVLALLVYKALLPSLEGKDTQAAHRQIIEIAAGIELIHMATLLHDDIIDKSPLRRHQTSAYKLYGTPASLLAGDFLLVRAFSLCSRLDRVIIDATEAACVALTEGEIIETPLYKEKHDLASSLNIASKKTAALFKLAALAGTHITTSDKALVAKLADFGENLGVAFQILDDILDVNAREEALGKKIGIDILERKPSVVNVLWLESGSELAKLLLSEPSAEDEEQFLPAALSEIREGTVIKDANQLAKKHINLAEEALNELLSSNFPFDHSFIEDLQALLNYSTQRTG